MILCGKMDLLILIFILNFGLYRFESSGEEASYSTSVIAMTKLLKTERWMLDLIRDDVVNLKNHSSLKIAVANLNQEHAKSDVDPEAYLSNPLNSFTLLRRLYEDWPIIIHGLGSGAIRKFEQIGESVDFPAAEDLSEAAMGMKRIRETYNLRSGDLAEGRFNDVKYDAKLSKFDLFEIGYELYKLEDYVEAASWLNASLHTNYMGLLPFEILNFDEDFIRSLYDEILREQGISYSIQFNKEEEEEGEKRTINYSYSYESSCRGEHIKVSSELVCRYNTTVSPLQILAPSKLEELSKDPFIMLYHDVLTQGEIEEIKDQTRNNLERARIFYEGGHKIASSDRTAHDACVLFRNATIAKIIGITGLNSEGFERPTVVNYGLGGHYDIHNDYFHPMKDSLWDAYGDRIATILIYLNDVERGGATVFPEVGIYVTPQKGALLLWYNLKNNGFPDEKTIHGACPVAYGSKWAATIWVRELAQFRSLPCYDP